MKEDRGRAHTHLHSPCTRAGLSLLLLALFAASVRRENQCETPFQQVVAVAMTPTTVHSDESKSLMNILKERVRRQLLSSLGWCCLPPPPMVGAAFSLSIVGGALLSPPFVVWCCPPPPP